MADIINFEKKKKELDIKNNNKNIESNNNILNITEFGSFDEIISYYINLTNLTENINDFAYDVLNNELPTLKGIIESTKETENKIINLYNKYHKENSTELEVAYVTVLSRVLNHTTWAIMESSEIIEKEVNRILKDSKENIDYKKIVQNSLDNDEFRTLYDAYDYYRDLSYALRDEIDDDIFDIINNDFKILRSLNDEIESKLNEIYNLYHKKYKNNNELLYASIITNLLSDFSNRLIISNKEDIIKAIESNIKKKKL